MNLPYEKTSIGGKDVYIVEAHHFVLFPWAEIRRTQPIAPSLITLDHHTDTLDAFHHHRYAAANGDWDTANAMLPALIADINWKNNQSLVNAVDKLCHDEHIRAAVSSGIISRALVIHLSVGTWTELDRIYVAGSICAVDCKKASHNDACKIPHYAQVLESIYLDRELTQLNEMVQADGLPPAEAAPYILDIDLDYFHSERAINPGDPSTFYRLVRNSIAVTIALEPECVEELRCEGSTVTSEVLLDRIREHIEAAMT